MNKMSVKSLDHIAIAVKNLSEAIKLYQEVFGVESTETTTVESQGVNIAFMSLGETRIELLEPTHSESPVAKFLEKRGEGLHHIAFSVEEINITLQHLQSLGIRLIDNQPREGAHGVKIAFIHPKNTLGVLTELTESKKEHGR